MTTCPSIVGVMWTFTRTRGAPAPLGVSHEWLALVPGRGRDARLRLNHLVRPDDELPALLPLEGHHPVRHLESVPVHLVVAEDRAHLQLNQLLGPPICVYRAGPLDSLG